jgi:uncharacterized membrane protein
MQKGNNEKHIKMIHIGFEIGLIIKGVDAVLEIIGGFLMFFLNQSRLSKIINFIIQPELLEDPNDRIANALAALSRNFSIDAQHFGIFYLLTHGFIKLFIVSLLWSRKLWAYPFSIIALILFIIYQIYRYIINPSAWLILLTILDIIMIVLTILEYRRMKYRFHPPTD